MSSIKFDTIEKTVYGDIKDHHEGIENASAIEYFGESITNGEFDESVKVYSNSYDNFGVKAENKVTMCTLIIPEFLKSFYSATNVGVIPNLVSPTFLRANGPRYLDELNSDTIMVLDKFYPVVAEAISKTNVKKIIISSLADSAPEVLKPKLGGSSKALLDQLAKGKHLIPGKEYYSNIEFEAAGKGPKTYKEAQYRKDTETVNIYSSGTTDDPKGILYSTNGINNMGIIYDNLGFDLVAGVDRNLVLIPPNHATSLIHCTHEPFRSGCTLVLQPLYDKNKFAHDLLTLKPQIVMAAASHFATLPKANLSKGCLSHVRWCFCGGEPVPYELAVTIAETLEYLGVQNPYLVLGYGNSEGGPLSLIELNNPNLVGEVGKAAPGVETRIVDEYGNPVSNGKRGYLEIKTPARMLGYANNPRATDEYRSKDGFDKPKDIAVKDDEGRHKVFGRGSDSFKSAEGRREYLFDIEKVILKSEPAILECEAVALEIDSENEKDRRSVPVIHIVMKPGYEHEEFNLIKRLNEKCLKELGQYQIPYGYKIINEFGTNEVSGKRDTEALKHVRKGFYIPDPTDDNCMIEIGFPKRGQIELKHVPAFSKIPEKNKVLKMEKSIYN